MEPEFLFLVFFFHVGWSAVGGVFLSASFVFLFFPSKRWIGVQLLIAGAVGGSALAVFEAGLFTVAVVAFADPSDEELTRLWIPWLISFGTGFAWASIVRLLWIAARRRRAG